DSLDRRSSSASLAIRSGKGLIGRAACSTMIGLDRVGHHAPGIVPEPVTGGEAIHRRVSSRWRAALTRIRSGRPAIGLRRLHEPAMAPGVNLYLQVCVSTDVLR